MKLASGADRDEVQDAIAAALADHPDAKVMDQDQFEADASGFIDSLLIFVTVMLLLAVVIALLGIVNTLALSVFERTRELGLLRAVGMTRSQVRAMVRWESVVIALIGAVTGAGLGIGIGVGLAHMLEDEGITGIAIPGPQIALYVALAAVAGVLAAIGPAKVGRQGRRAQGGGHGLIHPSTAAGRCHPTPPGRVPGTANPPAPHHFHEGARHEYHRNPEPPDPSYPADLGARPGRPAA